MSRILRTTALGVSACCFLAVAVKPHAIPARAKKLHFSSIVVDTHDDTTQRFLDGKFDLGARHTDGSIDIPRMREGGLHAIFFSIWIPSKITGQEAVNRALAQIAAVREQVRAHPQDLVLATTAAEVRAAQDRKSTRLNSSHGYISYAVFCLKKKNQSTYTSVK